MILNLNLSWPLLHKDLNKEIKYSRKSNFLLIWKIIFMSLGSIEIFIFKFKILQKFEFLHSWFPFQYIVSSRVSSKLLNYLAMLFEFSQMLLKKLYEILIPWYVSSLLILFLNFVFNKILGNFIVFFIFRKPKRC